MDRRLLARLEAVSFEIPAGVLRAADDRPARVVRVDRIAYEMDELDRERANEPASVEAVWAHGEGAPRRPSRLVTLREPGGQTALVDPEAIVTITTYEPRPAPWVKEPPPSSPRTLLTFNIKQSLVVAGSVEDVATRLGLHSQTAPPSAAREPDGFVYAIQQRDARIAELETERTQLNHTIAQADVARRGAENSLAGARNELRRAEREHSIALVRVAELEEALRATQNANLVSELNEARGELRRVTEEREGAHAQIVDLERDKALWLEKAEVQGNANIALRNEVKELRTRYETIAVERDEALAKVRALAADKDQAVANYNALRDERGRHQNDAVLQLRAAVTEAIADIEACIATHGSTDGESERVVDVLRSALKESQR